MFKQIYYSIFSSNRWSGIMFFSKTLCLLSDPKNPDRVKPAKKEKKIVHTAVTCNGFLQGSTCWGWVDSFGSYIKLISTKQFDLIYCVFMTKVPKISTFEKPLFLVLVTQEYSTCLWPVENTSVHWLVELSVFFQITLKSIE